jgi:hypothetical protein
VGDSLTSTFLRNQLGLLTGSLNTFSPVLVLITLHHSKLGARGGAKKAAPPARHTVDRDLLLSVQSELLLPSPKPHGSFLLIDEYALCEYLIGKIPGILSTCLRTILID